jgi:hypothetical protein
MVRKIAETVEGGWDKGDPLGIMNLCRHSHEFHIDCKASIFDSIAEQLSVFYKVKIHFGPENA